MDNRKSSTYTAWNEKPGLYQFFVYNLKKKITKAINRNLIIVMYQKFGNALMVRRSGQFHTQ